MPASSAPSSKVFSLAELAQRTGARLAGDGTVRIVRVATLQDAVAGDISFLSNPRYRDEVAASRASAVILAADAADLTAVPRLVHANPYACFARVAQLLDPYPAAQPGVHHTATVAASARLGANVSVGAHATIGEEAEIGADTIIYPNVTIYPRVRIGARCIIHAGAVIGADGFGFANQDGRWVKIPQSGSVILGDDVEVGANTTIDRGALADTVIGEGVKLDNQIQIGHNVRIGEHTAIAACAGIAGSTTVGAYCSIGGAAMIHGHISVADRVTIGAGAMVRQAITEPGGVYGGTFPIAPVRDWLKNVSHLRNLDRMNERIRALEKRLADSD
ncbi:MAG TPA: UDP-3-O-(3-hydroxymyristoyl)glucosamine N-acyltransferase, partial [Burkholderiales bacterium]|nr:UDP-3-O-(3-hydroxymyristoyl)glucosamine N-acyltransferase [Burkholderiales bacterium]